MPLDMQSIKTSRPDLEFSLAAKVHRSGKSFTCGPVRSRRGSLRAKQLSVRPTRVHGLSLLPVQVSGITDAVAVAAGSGQSCAVLTSGTVRCWGNNNQGQLGNNSTTDSLVPVTVDGL